jgi:hypothetical protein
MGELATVPPAEYRRVIAGVGGVDAHPASGISEVITRKSDKIQTATLFIFIPPCIFDFYSLFALQALYYGIDVEVSVYPPLLFIYSISFGNHAVASYHDQAF